MGSQVVLDVFARLSRTSVTRRGTPNIAKRSSLETVWWSKMYSNGRSRLFDRKRPVPASFSFSTRSTARLKRTGERLASDSYQSAPKAAIYAAFPLPRAAFSSAALGMWHFGIRERHDRRLASIFAESMMKRRCSRVTMPSATSFLRHSLAFDRTLQILRKNDASCRTFTREAQRLGVELCGLLPLADRFHDCGTQQRQARETLNVAFGNTFISRDLSGGVAELHAGHPQCKAFAQSGTHLGRHGFGRSGFVISGLTAPNQGAG